MRGFLALPIAVLGVIVIAAALALDNLGNLLLQLSCAVAGTPASGHYGTETSDHDDDFRL